MATEVPYKDLASGVNEFMSNQAIAPFLQNMPDYANLVGKRGEITGDMLSGQLPKDVMQQIQQAGAERGVASGSPGSPNANAAMLRALGLNSLQMQGQGNQLLSQSIADTPVPQLWNPMSLYVPEALGNQTLNAARAGQASGASNKGFGGISYTGATGGAPNFMDKAAIPRFDPGIISAGAAGGSGPSFGFDTPLPQSSYDNWWDTYGSYGSTSMSQAPLENYSNMSFGTPGFDDGGNAVSTNPEYDFLNFDWMSGADDEFNPDWMFGSDVQPEYDYSLYE